MDTATTDSTKISDKKSDTSDKRMNDKEVSNMDNELMNSMKVMMDKMNNMKMSGDFDLDNDGKKEPSIAGFPDDKIGNKLIFAWTDAKDKTIKVANLSL
jgi:archaellum component FlaD/FlaE